MFLTTDFDAFINQGWQQHEAEPQQTYNQLEQASTWSVTAADGI
ncbi:hypothetical protein [Vibrio sp. AND4]|nr:hypothetical protein [Vibrio sp. AND4]EDP59813.1 hypothetical protein AND4_11664 [Vibrio sp. AND4]